MLLSTSCGASRSVRRAMRLSHTATPTSYQSPTIHDRLGTWIRVDGSMRAAHSLDMNASDISISIDRSLHPHSSEFGTWDLIVPATAVRPPPLESSAMRLFGSEIWIFGGFTGEAASRQLWKYDIGTCMNDQSLIGFDWIGYQHHGSCIPIETNEWTMISPRGDAPDPRSAAAMVCTRNPRCQWRHRVSSRTQHSLHRLVCVVLQRLSIPRPACYTSQAATRHQRTRTWVMFGVIRWVH